MTSSTRMTLAAGAAVGLGAAPVGAVFDNWSWLWYGWAAVAAVVGAHLLARYLRLPAALVPVAGALGLLLYLTAVFSPDGALLSLLPTPDSLRVLRDQFSVGFEDVNQFAAPVPTTDGLTLLTAAALGLVAVAVDLVAVTFRRPAASGLTLLALYAVPTAVVLAGVPWILFAIAASGFLLLLLVEGRDRLLQWGRPVKPAAGADGRAAHSRDTDSPPPLTGQRIGALAILLAVILPLLVPGMTGNALNRLGQSGNGESGTGTGGALNEFAALRGELRQGNPTDLFTVRSNQEQIPYLRTTTLDRFLPGGFASSTGSGRITINDDTVLPTPTGQVSTVGPDYTAIVDLSNAFDDDNLPVFYLPTQLQGVGDGWRWDQDRAIVSSRERRGGFQYTMSGVEPSPTTADLENSPAMTEEQRQALPERLSINPPNLPPLIRETVTRVTSDAGNSPYRKAKAINDYFTDGSNGFTYAENTIQGNSGNVLVDFLTKKQGYCEQYAAAMAVMLRVAGIPSRVVIGYTPGRKRDDGSWTVSNRDAHAWVEGYFQNVGWAYFDPTPLADGRTVAPAYAPRPSASNEPSSSTSNGASASAGPTGNQLPQEDLNPGAASGTTGAGGLVTPRRLLTALVVLAVLLVLLLPAAVRLLSRRRRLRLASGADPAAAARAAWDEVVGTAADYGVPVPASETPRGLARRLDRDLSLDGEASRGLRLVALAEERARYAARAGVDGDLPSAVRAVRRGLRGEAGRQRRWRATLLPPSTVRAARTGSAVRAASASASINRLGVAVRRPVTPRRR